MERGPQVAVVVYTNDIYQGAENKMPLSQWPSMCYLPRRCADAAVHVANPRGSFVIRRVAGRFRDHIDGYLNRAQLWLDERRAVPPRPCRVIGGMATMPSRQHTLTRSLPSILRQVDALYLYLDGHSATPRFVAEYPKIVAIPSDRYPGLRGAGKFLALIHEHESGVFASFDDDIHYPYNYVQSLLEGLERHGRECLVGYHGSLLPEEMKSFEADRHVIFFEEQLADCQHVHVLGTGTTAFWLDTLRFDPRSWQHQNMSDLQLALEAAKQGLPMVCLKRKERFLKSLDMVQEDSIYAALLEDDTVQTELAQKLLSARVQ